MAMAGRSHLTKSLVAFGCVVTPSALMGLSRYYADQHGGIHAPDFALSVGSLLGGMLLNAALPPILRRRHWVTRGEVWPPLPLLILSTLIGFIVLLIVRFGVETNIKGTYLFGTYVSGMVPYDTCIGALKLSGIFALLSFCTDRIAALVPTAYGLRTAVYLVFSGVYAIPTIIFALMYIYVE